MAGKVHGTAASDWCCSGITIQSAGIPALSFTTNMNMNLKLSIFHNDSIIATDAKTLAGKAFIYGVCASLSAYWGITLPHPALRILAIAIAFFLSGKLCHDIACTFKEWLELARAADMHEAKSQLLAIATVLPAVITFIIGGLMVAFGLAIVYALSMH